METEIWKQVPNSYLWASNLGRIKSLDRIGNYRRGGGDAKRKYWGRILTQNWNRHRNYFTVAITHPTKETGMKILKAHRVVASAFLPNPDNLPEINHKDGNRLNNRIENLEWCSHADNVRHAHKNGLIKYAHMSGVDNPNNKLSEDDIRQIDKLLSTKVPAKIAEQFGVGRTTIVNIKYRRRWYGEVLSSECQWRFRSKTKKK